MITPRPYQLQLVDGARELWRTGARRIAAVMATGGGKTVVFSVIAAMAYAAGKPTLVLAHRKELIDAAVDKLQQVNPGARVGVFKGPLKQWRSDFVVASVDTARGDAALNLLKAAGFGLIVVDECHHIAANSYQKILAELGAFGQRGPLVLGVTATLDRADGRSLGDTFEAVVDPQIGLIDLIRQGYLVRPRGIRVRIAALDLARVRRTAGDLNAGQLGAAMTEAMAPQRIVEAWTEHAKGRPTVVFLPTVAVSIDTAEAFRQAGFTAAHLDGTTGDAARDDALNRFRSGEIDVICNVGLFTEGTDLPMISCVVLARPTSSTTLYQQMLGRGLRTHPGKLDCIVLDVTGVTGRHKLATLVSLNGAPAPDDVPDDLLLYEDDADPDGDRDDEQDEPAEQVYADGRLEHELIDLFGASHSNWLRTIGGTWFIPAGPNGFVYLEPLPDDRYRVKWASDGGTSGEIQSDMELEYAMARGDEYVAGNPIWQAERDAPWRKMRVRGGRTKGEVADERAVQRASRLLDVR